MLYQQKQLVPVPMLQQVTATVKLIALPQSSVRTRYANGRGHRGRDRAWRKVLVSPGNKEPHNAPHTFCSKLKQVHRHTDANGSTQPGKAGERQLFQTRPSAGHLEKFLLSSSMPAPAFKGSWAARKGSRGPHASCFKVTRGPRVGGQAQIPVAQLGRPGAHPHHWPFTGASAKSRTANSTHSKLRFPNMAAKALRPGHLLLLGLVAYACARMNYSRGSAIVVRFASQVPLKCKPKCRLSRPWRISARTSPSSTR